MPDYLKFRPNDQVIRVPENGLRPELAQFL